MVGATHKNAVTRTTYFISVPTFSRQFERYMRMNGPECFIFQLLTYQFPLSYKIYVTPLDHRSCSVIETPTGQFQFYYVL